MFLTSCPLLWGETKWPFDTLRGVYRRAYEGARRVYFVSEHNRRITEQQLGQRIDRAEVVRNAMLVNASGPLPRRASGDGRLRLAWVAFADRLEQTCAEIGGAAAPWIRSFYSQPRAGEGAFSE